MRTLVALVFFLGLNSTLFAQKDSTVADINQKLVQFSGVIVDDSLNAIPYAYVRKINSTDGTVSDYYGYFSFVAKKGDTIRFSSISFRDAIYIIPDTLSGYRYSIIQMMQSDATELDQINVYPWPTKDQFVDAFLDLDLGTGYDLAAKNLKRQELAAQAQGVNNDSYLSYKDALRDQQQKVYYTGQAPTINILNPVAWGKFLQAWRNGDFKQ